MTDVVAIFVCEREERKLKGWMGLPRVYPLELDEVFFHPPLIDFVS